MWRLLKRLPFLRNPATRRRLRQLPVIRHLLRASMKTRRAYYRHYGRYWLARKVAASPRKRIVIGAWSRFDPGWIPTQREFLNLTDPGDFQRFFQPNSVEAMLAEHVWEHITPEEGLEAAKTCFKYLQPGGYLRVAVPDGLHPDPTYIDLVRPSPGSEAPASGPNGNSANHKALYTYRTLRQLFETAGFRVVPYEYFDEAGEFHCLDWDRRAGTIWRSKRFDPRNRTGRLASVYPGTVEDYLSYSSIILDAVKDAPENAVEQPTHQAVERAPRKEPIREPVGVTTRIDLLVAAFCLLSAYALPAQDEGTTQQVGDSTHFGGTINGAAVSGTAQQVDIDTTIYYSS